jgi:hypothetical protein
MLCSAVQPLDSSSLDGLGLSLSGGTQVLALLGIMRGEPYMARFNLDMGEANDERAL